MRKKWKEEKEVSIEKERDEYEEEVSIEKERKSMKERRRELVIVYNGCDHLFTGKIIKQRGSLIIFFLSFSLSPPDSLQDEGRIQKVEREREFRES